MTKDEKLELEHLEKMEIRFHLISTFDNKYCRYYSKEGDGMLDLVAIEGKNKKIFYELKIVKKAKSPAGGNITDQTKKIIAKDIIDYYEKNKNKFFIPKISSKGIIFEFPKSKDIYEIEIIKKMKNYDDRCAAWGSKDLYANAERLK